MPEGDQKTPGSGSDANDSNSGKNPEQKKKIEPSKGDESDKKENLEGGTGEPVDTGFGAGESAARGGSGSIANDEDDALDNDGVAGEGTTRGGATGGGAAGGGSSGGSAAGRGAASRGAAGGGAGDLADDEDDGFDIDDVASEGASGGGFSGGSAAGRGAAGGGFNDGGAAG